MVGGRQPTHGGRLCGEAPPPMRGRTAGRCPVRALTGVGLPLAATPSAWTTSSPPGPAHVDRPGDFHLESRLPRAISGRGMWPWALAHVPPAGRRPRSRGRRPASVTATAAARSVSRSDPRSRYRGGVGVGLGHIPRPWPADTAPGSRWGPPGRCPGPGADHDRAPCRSDDAAAIAPLTAAATPGWPSPPPRPAWPWWGGSRRCRSPPCPRRRDRRRKVRGGAG